MKNKQIKINLLAVVIGMAMFIGSSSFMNLEKHLQ